MLSTLGIVNIAETFNMLVRIFHVHFNQSVRSLHYSSILLFKQQSTIQKRAEKLLKLIESNKQRKHWHLQLGATGYPEKSIYNKVSRPHKRATVLNSLFMKNITDVLSTGDVCPEIMGYGVEITGVRVTSDYQIVNVYWQIPSVMETCNSDVEVILARSAPNIRGELIRRNVLGKVPRIFFIRDPSNKRASDIQRCLEASGVSEIKDHPSLPAEELLKNIYRFTEKKDLNPKKSVVEEPEKPKVSTQSPVPTPETPPDMKLDVMGLDHEKLFNRVLAAKKKPKELCEAILPIVPHVTEDGEESEKHKIKSIQADPLFGSREREMQIKKFCIERKTKWTKIKGCIDDVESVTYNVTVTDIVDDTTEEDFEEDYFEEEDEGENKDTDHKPV